MHPLKFMPNNQGAGSPMNPWKSREKKTQRFPVIRDLHCGALDLGTSPVFGARASNLLSSSVKVSLFPGNNQPGVFGAGNLEVGSDVV